MEHCCKSVSIQVMCTWFVLLAGLNGDTASAAFEHTWAADSLTEALKWVCSIRAGVEGFLQIHFYWQSLRRIRWLEREDMYPNL